MVPLLENLEASELGSLFDNSLPNGNEAITVACLGKELLVNYQQARWIFYVAKKSFRQYFQHPSISDGPDGIADIVRGERFDHG